MSDSVGFMIYDKKNGWYVSKIYSKIGYAKRWITDRKSHCYKNIDDYELHELVVGTKKPMMDHIGPEKIMEILKYK
jgi:hypothetical protein